MRSCLKNYWIFFLIVLSSCAKQEDAGTATPEVEFYTPQGFPAPYYDLSGNPLSYARFSLGRKLFYDPVLSIDSTIACGSCHQQSVAFAHADHRLSHGVNNLLGTRNSPVIFNMAWNPAFFWDGGVHNLELQPLGPITNPVEMAETLPGVISKLRNSSTYPALFKSAFGTDTIITDHVMKALAQFMAVMISDKSKYDFYLAGKATFTASEERGLAVFRAHCNSCHREPLFSDFSYRNNGLDSVFTADAGRARITNLPQDSGKFKVPTLRNIVLSKPYMHDGRLGSLSAVLDHYQGHIRHSATLDPLLVNGITLNSRERSDLLAFLATLTDATFTHNREFSEQ